MLSGGAAWFCNTFWPVRNPWHTNSAFGQIHFAAHQRPVVTEPFAAVVAGENDQGVVELACFSQSIHYPTYAFVHVVNHAVVGVNVATLKVKNIVFDGLRQCVVFTRFPWPMGRRVVHAQEKRLRGVLRHSLHKVD